MLGIWKTEAGQESSLNDKEILRISSIGDKKLAEFLQFYRGSSMATAFRARGADFLDLGQIEQEVAEKLLSGEVKVKDIDTTDYINLVKREIKVQGAPYIDNLNTSKKAVTIAQNLIKNSNIKVFANYLGLNLVGKISIPGLVGVKIWLEDRGQLLCRQVITGLNGEVELNTLLTDCTTLERHKVFKVCIELTMGYNSDGIYKVMFGKRGGYSADSEEFVSVQRSDGSIRAINDKALPFPTIRWGSFEFNR